MKEKFWKAIPLVIALVAMTAGYSSTIKGQKETQKYNYDQGHVTEEHQMMSAYN